MIAVLVFVSLVFFAGLFGSPEIGAISSGV